MFQTLLTLIGLVIIVGGSYLFSSDKKNINWKSISCIFIGQIALTFIMIKTPVWKLIEIISRGMEWLISQSSEGISFVFGSLLDTGFVFFLSSLMPIVFLSGLIGILFHFGIIQKFVAFVGKTVAKLLNVDTLISINNVANCLMGQNESMFLLKSYMPTAKESVVFASMVSGMSSISVTVLGLYTSYGAAMEYLIISMPLTVCSCFILTQVIMPTKYEEVENLTIDTSDKGENWIETAINYSTVGFKSVIGITIALLLFLSLVFMVNNLLALTGFNITLQKILGIIFYPVALLMGAPMNEVPLVAELLASKLVFNESVAFALPAFTALSEATKNAVTVALCAFSGFGSIGILLGGMSAIAPNQVKVVAKLGMKALLTATFASAMTGMLVSLFL